MEIEQIPGMLSQKDKPAGEHRNGPEHIKGELTAGIGGQQIGQLEATGYCLASNGLFLLLNDGFEFSPPMDNVVLKEDDVTEFTLDWAEPYGQLSSGEYRIMLYVHDVYDESQKHPLMRNFYDTQIYNLDFTVS